MPAPTLLSVFPKPEDLLAATPEDLAGVLIEVMPSLMQNDRVHIQSFRTQLYRSGPPSSYPPYSQSEVDLALAEALSWLVTQGLIVSDPGQSWGWYVRARRAHRLQTRVDVEGYRKGHILPADLLPDLF